jgi:drug/metabolite transporter (DMT)-like permease
VIWSTTWFAITFQLGSVPPEISVFYRFFLAALLLFAGCRLRSLDLRIPAREHFWLVLFGLLTFSVGYILVYRAESHLASGLVAVGYSASPLLGMLGMRLFFGTPMTGRMWLASALGIAGVVLVFLPEILRLGESRDAVRGIAFTAAAVLTSSLGGMVAQRNQHAQLPVWQSMAWGMLYGSALCLAIALVSGKRFAFEATAPYVLSLLYLTVLGSILAFAAWLLLLQRIGVARAGYIGVMVPVLALFISAALEGFRFHALTWAGITASVVGNVLVLRKG